MSKAINATGRSLDGVEFNLNIIIPMETKRIDENITLGFRELLMYSVEITLPEIPIIGFRAFEGCTNLRKLNVPNGVKVIESDAFKGATSLEEINFSKDAFLQIANCAFIDSKKLKKVSLPALTKVAMHAFSENTYIDYYSDN